MQRDDVTLGQQPVEIAAPAGHAGVATRVVQHLHAEAGGAPGDRLPDATEADDAEDGAVHVAPEVLVDVPARPSPGAQVGLRLPDLPRRRQDQQEREIGGRVVEHTGCVGDRDAVGGGGVEVDVVVPDRDRGDDLHPGAARRQHGVVDLIGQPTDDRVDSRCLMDDLVVRERPVAVGLDELVAGFDQRVQPVREPARDQDARQTRVSARCSRLRARP